MQEGNCPRSLDISESRLSIYRIPPVVADKLDKVYNAGLLMLTMILKFPAPNQALNCLSRMLYTIVYRPSIVCSTMATVPRLARLTFPCDGTNCADLSLDIATTAVLPFAQKRGVRDYRLAGLAT